MVSHRFTTHDKRRLSSRRAPNRATPQLELLFLAENRTLRPRDGVSPAESGRSLRAGRRTCFRTGGEIGRAEPFGKLVPVTSSPWDMREVSVQDHAQARFWIVHAYPEPCLRQMYVLAYEEAIQNRPA
ncbi:hypothetical protein Bbelb_141530 [Branchiostoma belcheri]|nr:hypothetical protein Bbelb_141530 [Branchiostoma belcheri]